MFSTTVEFIISGHTTKHLVDYSLAVRSTSMSAALVTFDKLGRRITDSEVPKAAVHMPNHAYRLAVAPEHVVLPCIDCP